MTETEHYEYIKSIFSSISVGLDEIDYDLSPVEVHFVNADPNYAWEEIEDYKEYAKKELDEETMALIELLKLLNPTHMHDDMEEMGTQVFSFTDPHNGQVTYIRFCGISNSYENSFDYMQQVFPTIRTVSTFKKV